MLNEQDFIQNINGKKTALFTLENAQGNIVQITNYGARIVAFIVNNIDIVIGHKDINNYLNSNERYFNAIIGRYANRIKEGKFFLDGKFYQLTVNNGPNHLHGGKNGLNEKVWDVLKSGKNFVELSTNSKDGEDGFPANIEIKVLYEFNDSNELKISYFAKADKDTIINLTNHAFFNLNKDQHKNILDTILQINADYFLPIDSTSIPLGRALKVQGTPFDFSSPKEIGRNIFKEDTQLKVGHGYDHNFILKDDSFAARAFSKDSGLLLEVNTTEPGLQLYTGNFLEGQDTGKNNIVYQKHLAFCLETQHFPDSPNHPEYPSVFLKAGEIFTSTTTYKVTKK